jgi:hypothetical protein
MSSPLVELVEEAPSIADKKARRNWVARQYYWTHRKQWEEDAASVQARGYIDWNSIRVRYLHEPLPPPAPTCQWIGEDGGFCGEKSQPGYSWCPQHRRRVFRNVNGRIVEV